MILFGMINKNQNFQVLLIVNWVSPLERMTRQHPRLRVCVSLYSCSNRHKWIWSLLLVLQI